MGTRVSIFRELQHDSLEKRQEGQHKEDSTSNLLLFKSHPEGLAQR